MLAHAEQAVDQPPVRICLLGNFRLLKRGRRVPTDRSGKAVTLLSNLGLHWQHGLPRDQLLLTLWPSGDRLLARQSLNSLVHRLRQLFADAIEGDGPVVYADGAYRLNVDAGVSVDVAEFERLISEGDRLRLRRDTAAARDCYARAVEAYVGDLCMDADPQDVIERERLRSDYLRALSHVADYDDAAGDRPSCLRYLTKLLAADPCREDAHRQAIRCYIHLGQRAQALRQFRLCESVLRMEFDAQPEPETVALFERVRLNPSRI